MLNHTCIHTWHNYVTVSVQCHCAHCISIRLYQYATTSLNYIRSTNNQPYFPSAHFFAPCPAPAPAFLFLTCNVLSPLHACICGHKQQCSRCIECGGSEICEICRECGGDSICEHKRQRSKLVMLWGPCQSHGDSVVMFHISERMFPDFQRWVENVRIIGDRGEDFQYTNINWTEPLVVGVLFFKWTTTDGQSSSSHLDFG